MSTSASDYNSGISSSPAYNAVAVTPSDSANLAQTARALYIGVSGDVKIDCPGGGSGIVFKAAPVGILPVMATKVYATGTAATNIVALI